jgi:hypothetical protein
MLFYNNNNVIDYNFNLIFFKKFLDYNIFLDYYVEYLNNSDDDDDDDDDYEDYNNKGDIFNFNLYFNFLLNNNIYNLKKVNFKIFIYYILNINNFNNILNIFYYDLIFRFPKISYLRNYVLYNYINDNYNDNIDVNSIYFSLTPLGGVGLSISNLTRRMHFLTVGNFNYLPMHITYSGYFSPIITSLDKNYFFSPDSEFTSLNNFKYLSNYYYSQYNNYNTKASTIFPYKVPNINIKILFFFAEKTLNNLFNNNLFYKSYNVFINNNDQ